MNLTFDREALLGAVDAVVNKTMEMDLQWSWPCGVAYYGVARAAEAAGREDYYDYLKARVDEHRGLGLPAWNVNACAMGYAVLTLYQKTGDEAYLALVNSKRDYLLGSALRFGEGVLQHTVSSDNDFPEQAWADTLFMAAYFMLRAGVALGDKALIEDALNQYFWHIEYLQNKENGLWYHGYDNTDKANGGHMSGFHWGRANAWAAYTMSRVKDTLPEPYLYPPYMQIDCSLRDQLTGLKKLQAPDGLWRTLLDDAESYGEVSATAGIGAAMINNNNPLHTAYAQKALDAVLANISPDGRVLNVSGGTAVMKDREGYMNIPRTWTQGWGQGLALALLSSALEPGAASDAVSVSKQ
ncbi:MAG: glycoside hydrolase family 88 protein [Clostridiales bacterium]|jgi:unsaturated rhamnogalacturonyl hydrolase|nr:glycoside hydrolase family 88 protein [Clostridiales bacterium]